MWGEEAGACERVGSDVACDEQSLAHKAAASVQVCMWCVLGSVQPNQKLCSFCSFLLTS